MFSSTMGRRWGKMTVDGPMIHRNEEEEGEEEEFSPRPPRAPLSVPLLFLFRLRFHCLALFLLLYHALSLSHTTPPFYT